MPPGPGTLSSGQTTASGRSTSAPLPWPLVGESTATAAPASVEWIADVTIGVIEFAPLSWVPAALAAAGVAPLATGLVEVAPATPPFPAPLGGACVVVAAGGGTTRGPNNEASPLPSARRFSIFSFSAGVPVTLPAAAVFIRLFARPFFGFVRFFFKVSSWGAAPRRRRMDASRCLYIDSHQSNR